MSATAKVIEHSVAPNGVELLTMQLRYPRFVHSEFMTHRVFSRNASSSRAIPVAKMLDQVRNEPAMPVHWGKNQAGMQAREEVTDPWLAEQLWCAAAREASKLAESMNEMGLHKQVANRILEPFQFISVIVTSTEWTNFFDLRDHPDADPNIQCLARAMKLAKDASKPVLRPRDRQITEGWHLPYITLEERAEWWDCPEFLAKLSAARCARVSYMKHDGTMPNHVEDYDLYLRLVGSRPLHASPVEHQGYPLPLADQWDKNFRGWRQHRSLVEHEMAHAA